MVIKYNFNLMKYIGIFFLLLMLLGFFNSPTALIKENNSQNLPKNQAKPNPIVIPPIIFNFFLWNYTTGAQIVDSPVIADLNNDSYPDVIFGSNDFHIYAVNGLNGKQLWNFTLTHGLSAEDVSPSIGDVNSDGINDVLISDNGYIIALSGNNGLVLWQYIMPWDSTFSPVISDLDNDGIPEVITGDKNNLFLLNGLNGHQKYNDTYVNTNYPSGVAIADLNGDRKQEIIVSLSYNTGSKAYLYAYTLDFSPIWDVPLNGSIITAPVLVNIDNDVSPEAIVATNSGYIYAVDNEDGMILWTKYLEQSELPVYFEGTPSVADLTGDNSMDFCLGGYYIVYCFNAKDGSILWKYNSPNALQGSFSIGDLNHDNSLDVLVIDSVNSVFALDGNTGKLLWKNSLPSQLSKAAVLADLDRDGDLEIVFGCHDYHLYALEPLTKPGTRIFWEAESGSYSFSWTKNANDIDRDYDSLSDYSEKLFGTNILLPDTDNDSLKDGFEVSMNLNPNNSDTDADGLGDGFEINTYHTNAANNDTDLDGMPDGWEVNNLLNPLRNETYLDYDLDGLTNLEEFTLGTLPRCADTDNDGLSDGAEVNVYDTNPLKWDTNGNGLSDGFEVNYLALKSQTNSISTTNTNSSSAKSKSLAIGGIWGLLIGGTSISAVIVFRKMKKNYL